MTVPTHYAPTGQLLVLLAGANVNSCSMAKNHT